MRDVNKTYDNLRKLAIIDAKRRLSLISKKFSTWDITDRLGKKGEPIGKMFIYTLDGTMTAFTNLTLNEYATIREVKYIVWRFEISKEEIIGA